MFKVVGKKKTYRVLEEDASEAPAVANTANQNLLDPPIDILSFILGGLAGAVGGVLLSDLLSFMTFGEPIVIPTAFEYMMGMYSNIRARFRRISERMPEAKKPPAP